MYWMSSRANRMFIVNAKSTLSLTRQSKGIILQYLHMDRQDQGRHTRFKGRHSTITTTMLLIKVHNHKMRKKGQLLEQSIRYSRSFQNQVIKEIVAATQCHALFLRSTMKKYMIFLITREWEDKVIQWVRIGTNNNNNGEGLMGALLLLTRVQSRRIMMRKLKQQTKTKKTVAITQRKTQRLLKPILFPLLTKTTLNSTHISLQSLTLTLLPIQRMDSLLSAVRVFVCVGLPEKSFNARIYLSLNAPPHRIYSAISQLGRRIEAQLHIDSTRIPVDRIQC